jgi:hypothetical protein
MKITAVVAVVILAVLAYGYWHASTHASLFVSLNIEGDVDHEAVSVLAAEICFLDASGRELATGIPDKDYNFVHLFHPSLGDCHEVVNMEAASTAARTPWQLCHEQLSVWIAKWIEDVDQITVTLGDCLLPTRQPSIRKASPGSKAKQRYRKPESLGESDVRRPNVPDLNGCVEGPDPGNLAKNPELAHGGPGSTTLLFP